jgi:predicted TPR repeat methyltransferase
MSSFDERAATWDDDPVKVERAAAVAGLIRETIALGPSTRLFEYGAGTGLVTQALRDAVGPVTLADTSTGMREVMQEKVRSGALPDARVWDVDLARDAPPPERFDVVVTVLTLHHIPELEPVLAAFASLLSDGGHLCIADLESEDGSFHGSGFEGHHGFDRAWLATRLEAAGFVGVEFRHCYLLTRETGTYPVFLATARIDRT